MNIVFALAFATSLGSIDLGKIELGPFPTADACQSFGEAVSPGIERAVLQLYNSGEEFAVWRNLDETPLRVVFRCEPAA